MTSLLPNRITKKYSVSLVGENDSDNSGEFLIIDYEDGQEYKITVDGNVYRDLKVLISHGSESQFDAQVDSMKLGSERMEPAYSSV